jgi:hypothetical protein
VGTINVTPLGRPYVEHAYQQVAYNPDRKRFTAALTSGTWEWDPATTGWTRLTPDVPASNSIGTTLLMYDPDLHTVLYFATTTFNHTVFRFDYEAARWTAHSSIPESLAWAELFSAYSSDDHKYLVSHYAGVGTWWLYDAVAQTWTPVTGAPANLLAASSIAYDPINRVFVVASRESPIQLWSYSAQGGTWDNLQPSGAAPMNTIPDPPNTLVYDAIWKRLYFINVLAASNDGQGGIDEGDVETWTYRHGGPMGPGDANCDDRLSAADLVMISSASEGAEACGAVDTNRDGVVDATDLSAAITALFSPVSASN